VKAFIVILMILFTSFTSGCAVLAIAAVPAIKAAKKLKDVKWDVGPRNNYTTIRGYKVYKYNVHPDFLFEEGQRWFCFAIDPIEKQTILKVWLEDYSHQDIVDCLTRQTVKIIDTMEASGRSPGNFCWIYNDDFNVGVVLNSVKNPEFRIQQRILEVPIPRVDTGRI